MYMVDVGFVKRSNCFTKKCYKENANNNNKEDIYALHCVNKKYHKRYRNRCVRMNIMFEIDDNSNSNSISNSSNDVCLEFPLYYDSEIYSKVPFDKMIIPLTTDDDVMSDIEIIEKARCLLHKELHYAILTKQHYYNHHTSKV